MLLASERSFIPPGTWQ